MLLKGRAKKIDKTAVIAQRLKRLPSIRAKLQREPMRLPQMQDIGGCRAIVKDTAALNSLIEVFKKNLIKNPKTKQLRRHEASLPTDYITSPKEDGYRSVHYIFTYRTSTDHLTVFDGHLIEVQIRTRLQHAWATAVEIVDTFTGQSLKTALRTHIGDKKWRRFFALMGSALAIREKTAPVPGTPTVAAELKRELKALVQELDVERVLMGLGGALQRIGTSAPGSKTHILILNSTDRSITVMSYGADQLELALDRYTSEEKRWKDDPAVQVVQVAVEDIEALQAAYPNYYLDTDEFLKAMRQAIR